VVVAAMSNDPWWVRMYLHENNFFRLDADLNRPE